MSEETLESLLRWKKEATEVLNGWEKVWEALDRPGELGALKSESVLAEVVTLRAQVARVETLRAQWEAERYPNTGDGGWSQGYDFRCEIDCDDLGAALAPHPATNGDEKS
jgi:hypothetical protein